MTGHTGKIAPTLRRLMLCGLLWSMAGWAGPPLVTDDPGLAGAGVLEAIVAAAGRSRSEREVIEAPQLDLTYGLRERLDLLFVAGFTEVRHDAGPSPESLPLVGGVKWQPWGSGGRVLVSTAPVVQADVRDSGSRSVFLPLQFEGSAGRWQLGGEIGYTAVRAAPDNWQAGLYTARPLAGGSVLLMELWTTETPETDERDLAWSAGAEIAISDGLRFLIAAGGGLDADGAGRIDGHVYIGLQRIVSFR